MEMKFNFSVFSALALAILVTWAWMILNYVWFRPKKLERHLKEQGLKGNPYRLWHGDLEDMKRLSLEAHSKPIGLHDDMLPYIVPYHYHIVQKHGKKSFIWHGPTPRVNIMDPEMIRDILFNYKTFQKPDRNPLARLLVAGLVLQKGDQWAKHRKILNPAFHLEKLKHMVPAMYLSCSEIVRKWEGLISAEGSCEADVWPYLANLSADVISRTAFGSSYEEGKRVFQLQAEQAKLTFQILQSNYVPGWRFLPTKINKRMKEINSETLAIMRDIVGKREVKMKIGEMKSDDLLGILMESNLREIEENGNSAKVGITIDGVIEECKLFYFAGQETTSNLLTWTMVMLAMHQHWQARAREEVLQVFGNNQPNSDGLSHLKIVPMILNEVLRLFPPAVMLLRTPHEKIKLGDFVVPPGVELILHIALTHHDQEIWGEDARTFNPERFCEGVAKAASKPGAFFPFGSGPRICIGLNFALMEAKLAIAMILQHFSFELSPSYAHAPFPMLTLQPRFGAHMILHKI